MKYKDFEDFLQDKHAEQYVGTDDMMIDDFEDWLLGLDIQEVIDWAEVWHKLLVKANKPI